MYKYWLIAQLFWQDSLVYRASFLMWRLRSFTSTLISLSVWSAIYQHQSQVFNYSQPAMLSYIFLTAILHSLILSTSLHSLANEIYSGQISFNLLKPINFMGMLISQELADKAINIIFAIGEINLLYLIFKPSFILPPSNTILIFIFWVALGIIIHFIINLLFGTIGFWSPDSWGPKFLFFMLIEFTAGKLYPLDILPQIIQKIIYLTPFPYLSYAQTQLFLGKVNNNQFLQTTLIMIAWILGLGLIYKLIWKNGLRNYTSMGQ